MTNNDDSKFRKLVALMRSTTFSAEAETCRAAAARIASARGLTIDQAIAGFDRGHNLQQTADIEDRVREKTESRRRHLERCAAIIEKYGDAATALAPCQRETLILAAVQPWRVPCGVEERWTDKLDGWSGWAWDYAKAPAQVVNAIRAAYPLPATVPEAKQEFEYWDSRGCEISDLLADPDEYYVRDHKLDLPAAIRWELVRDLFYYELEARTIFEIHARFAEFHKRETVDGCEQIEEGLLRDLGRLSEEKPHPSASVQSDEIAELIQANPAHSDRHIARVFGCSPTTVGNVRRSLGLRREARTVRRGGQIYEMRTSNRSRRGTHVSTHKSVEGA